MSYHEEMQIHERRIEMLKAAHARYDRPTKINAIAATLIIIGILSSGVLARIATLLGLVVLIIAVVDLVYAFRFNRRTKRELPPLPEDSGP